MTVYFMRYFKRISLILIIILFSLILMNEYSMPNGKILIKDIVVNKKNNFHYINFNQELNFDSLIINAINKGIPLVFKVVLRVVEKKEIWPTKIIKKEVRYYQIEYKALRKIYRVIDTNGKIHEYKNIAEATEKILKIKELELAIDDNGDFELWLNVSLDRKKLPKPLQVNYFDSTWNISSEKGIHKLGKLN
jgi:hypothetical protein